MQKPVTRTSMGFAPASIASALSGLSEAMALLEVWLPDELEEYEERAMVSENSPGELLCESACPACQ